MLTITLISAIVIITICVLWMRHQKSKSSIIRNGDIVTLKSSCKEDFPQIPHNNVLHIIGVDAEFVDVEYINFKDGTYKKEKLAKQVIRKVRKPAA